MEIIIFCVIIFVMILISGFFAGSETGLTAASKSQLHKLASDGDKRAKQALELQKNKDSLMGSLLLGYNIFSIGATTIAASITAYVVKDNDFALLITTGVMTFLTIVFGELIPKIYAYNNSVAVARMVAPVWLLLVKIFSPITKILQIFSLGLMRLFGYRGSKELVDGVEALRGAIEMQHEEGAVVKDDRDMLGSILDLSHLEVGEIAVHRSDMTTINIDDDPHFIIKQAVDSTHTRLPVWQDNPENIIGILITKDVLKLDNTPSKDEIIALLKEPMFIPETTSLRDQLQTFREKRYHLAIVVDEYGDLLGLITLEDILEEIVGQIDDEHDKVIRGIKKQGDGSYIARGNLNIRDLNRETDWGLPSDENANTVAGLVISIAEKIPNIGETFSYAGVEFTVLGKVRNQVTSVRLKEIPETEISDEQE